MNTPTRITQIEFFRAVADGVSIDEFEAVNASGATAHLCAVPPGWTIRLKQKFITVNGFSVPAPETAMPPKSTQYFYPCPLCTEFCAPDYVVGSEYDKLLLDRGLMHLTKEAADAHGKAMCGIDPKAKEGKA